MTMDPATEHVRVGVSAVIWNAHGRMLLIQRANPPRQGEWSLPGGKVEFGEPLRTAVLREIREETGLEIEILDLVDVAELLPDTSRNTDHHYVLIDFSARVLSGEPVAASDAKKARWFTMEEVGSLPLWDETRRVIQLSADAVNRQRS
jgi:8-oxo-dGTP diphosphatase